MVVSVLNRQARLLQCDNILPHIMLRRNNYLNAMPDRKSVGAKVPENEPARLTAGTQIRKLPACLSCTCAGHRPAPAKGSRGEIMNIIIWLIVGAIAGWLAGMVVKGGGFGLIGDIIVGIVGGLIAGWLLPRLGIYIGSGFVAAVIDSFIGAVILLLILRLVKRA
jgi:uncharacterized membrane protein YeaQ/YmgE (transglycosylase-associated protein family)